MKPSRAVPLLALIGLGMAPPARAEAPLLVTYTDRPPYMAATDSGEPAGLTATPAVQAFKAARIAVTWSKLPTNRQLLMIKEPASPNCAIGWFWLPEREQFAKFSKPIYRDKDWWVLANADFAARGAPLLADILRRKQTRVLVKENFSYGAQLDELLATYQPTIAVSTAPTNKMVQSVSKGVVDLMFVSEDEGNYIMAHAAELGSNVQLLHPKDMPHGPERHIMCSKTVPDELIQRLNQAIAFK